MSDLVVLGFQDKHRADEVLLAMQRMEKEHLVDLEDACVVVRDERGKVKLKQVQHLVASGSVHGGLWGLFIGTLFLHPLAGLLVGGTAGAVRGALRDVGIHDDFIKDVGAAIEPGTSALFVLVRKATTDKVLEELGRYGGKVLRTSMSHGDEEALKKALASAHG